MVSEAMAPSEDRSAAKSAGPVSATGPSAPFPMVIMRPGVWIRVIEADGALAPMASNWSAASLADVTSPNEIVIGIRVFGSQSAYQARENHPDRDWLTPSLSVAYAENRVSAAAAAGDWQNECFASGLTQRG